LIWRLAVRLSAFHWKTRGASTWRYQPSAGF